MSAIGNQGDTYKVGGRRIPFPHLDKHLFTDPDITKRELGQHYERVAPFMLPYVRDRPLSLQGFPPSSGDKGYYIKSEPSYFPDWIATTVVPKKDGTVTQVLGQNAATFVYLAGQDIITTHAWLSRADQLLSRTDWSSISIPRKGSRSPMSEPLPVRLVHGCGMPDCRPTRCSLAHVEFTSFHPCVAGVASRMSTRLRTRSRRRWSLIARSHSRWSFERTSAANASSSTLAATGTRRPRSSPMPFASGKARQSQPRCVGTSSKTPSSNLTPGRSRRFRNDSAPTAILGKAWPATLERCRTYWSSIARHVDAPPSAKAKTCIG